MANHIPAGWPEESLAGSDSEELGEKPCLKVETKVSVELHLDQQGNHCSEHLLDGDIGVQSRPGGAPPTQPPEQRKGASGWCGPNSPEVSGPESGGWRDGVRERGAMVVEGLLGKEGPAWLRARRRMLSFPLLPSLLHFLSFYTFQFSLPLGPGPGPSQLPSRLNSSPSFFLTTKGMS